jgi:hypothetical protein
MPKPFVGIVDSHAIDQNQNVDFLGDVAEALRRRSAAFIRDRGQIGAKMPCSHDTRKSACPTLRIKDALLISPKAGTSNSYPHRAAAERVEIPLSFSQGRC